ncbi:YbaB/EbfC family nucleoid-associated protein [Rhodococcus sp. NPDC127528]|uniref:YbaB/EbfC family nucleoid-associated protein n=1 Tax=unclassified Rhodococcus (in: high G+C Gram-positive bacteria) TaxID=192944 RepID=UPI0036424B0A
MPPTRVDGAADHSRGRREVTPDALGHRVQRAQRRLAELRVADEAGGGLVRLTLTADCRLVGLDLAPRALDLGAERLASLVAEAHERAYAAARRAADEVLVDLTDDPRVARALDAAHRISPYEPAVCVDAECERRPPLLVDPLGRDD